MQARNASLSMDFGTDQYHGGADRSDYRLWSQFYD